MADRHDRRRAGKYRQRAESILAKDLRRARDEDDRKHLIELAAVYRRAADEMAPVPPQAERFRKLELRNIGERNDNGRGTSTSAASK